MNALALEFFGELAYQMDVYFTAKNMNTTPWVLAPDLPRGTHFWMHRTGPFEKIAQSLQAYHADLERARTPTRPH
jgi:hypothetical protein